MAILPRRQSFNIPSPNMALNLEPNDKPNYQLIGFGLVMLFFMQRLALFDQDEAAYAGFGLMMERTGDYLVPDFLWSEPHRKTPLHFWMITGCFRLFGANEFALRIPAALSLIGTWLSIWWLAPPLFGQRVSRNAGYLIMASLLALVYGGISFTDGPLMLCQTVAALAILRLYKEHNWWMVLVLWLATAAGGLVKGPPIFILTIGMLGLIWLSGLLSIDKNIRQQPAYANAPNPWWTIVWGGVVLSAMAPMLFWAYLCWQQDNGVFISWLWDWYVTKRAGGAVWGQTGPPGYHLLIMGLSFLPVLAWYPGLVRLGFVSLKQQLFRTNPVVFLLLVWLIPGWFFYELQLSKLPSYALGAYGAFAISIATYLDKSPRYTKFGLIFQTVILVVLTIAIIGLSIFIVNSLIRTNESSFIEVVLAGVGVVSALFSGRLAFNNLNVLRGLPQANDPDPNYYVMQIMMMLSMIPVLMHQLDPLRGTTKIVANKIADARKATDPPILLAANFSQPSLPFYLAVKYVPYQYIEPADQSIKHLDSLASIHKACTIVCDKDKYTQLLTVPSNVLVGAQIDSLSGFVTDRRGGSQYWIITTKAK